MEQGCREVIPVLETDLENLIVLDFGDHQHVVHGLRQ